MDPADRQPGPTHHGRRANDNLVAICNGSTLYALIVAAATSSGRRDRRYTIAGPAVSQEQISVPTIKGPVESYKVVQDKLYAAAYYRSQGAVYMQPISTPRSIVWATDTGHMYVADGLSGRVRFRLEASDAIVGKPAYLGPAYIYAASIDGYLYCCDELSGDMLWRYSTGGSVSEGPIAAGESVYVVTNQGELHAVDYRPVEGSENRRRTRRRGGRHRSASREERRLAGATLAGGGRHRGILCVSPTPPLLLGPH